MAGVFEWGIKLAVNLIIFVVGLFGNLTVLWIIKKQKTKSLRPPFEYFITNLSVADMVFSITLVIGQYLNVPRSPFVCKAIIPIVSVTFQAGMHTVVAIAIFRCKAILSPFRFKPSGRIIFGTIAAIWIFAHVTYIPFYMVQFYVNKTGQCKEKWPSQVLNKVYTVALFVIQYPIPLVTIAVCYAKIAMFLKHHIVPHSGNGGGKQLQLARKKKQDRLVMKMSVIIVLSYTLLTLPTQIAWIGWVVFEYKPIKDVVFMFSNEFVLAHACCNPIVYGLISKQFRRQAMACYRTIIGCRWWRKNRVRNIDSKTETLDYAATR